MVLWFNHWFSTAYRFIELIRQGCKENNISIKIIGSNKFESCVYRNVCDEFYIEPSIYGDEYVDWCLNFCKEHNVNAFFPKHHRLDIAKRKDDFKKIFVNVLVHDNLDFLNLLENKYKTAMYFKENSICDIPNLFIVNTVSEFEEAYKKLKDEEPDNPVCIKFNIDEGAMSFYIIDEDEKISIENLRKKSSAQISYSRLIEILSSSPNFPDLIVMPYLEGPEISIDSLMTNDGFIAISRSKIGTRGTLVEYNKEFYEISKKFAEMSGIKYPYNIQLRKHNNKWFLLEVNTRMAGGTHKTAEIGINIPFIALCDLMSINCKLPDLENSKKIIVSQIETPVILNI